MTSCQSRVLSLSRSAGYVAGYSRDIEGVKHSATVPFSEMAGKTRHHWSQAKLNSQRGGRGFESHHLHHGVKYGPPSGGPFFNLLMRDDGIRTNEVGGR